MTNPILEALGIAPTKIAAFDPMETVVSIFIDLPDRGGLLLEGSLETPARMTCEGYYRVGYSGTHGPCISAVYSRDALRSLAASIIGARPKPGQVATLAATLPTCATVRFRRR